MAKVHHVEVGQLIQRLDQMTNSISQLLQLARVGQSFSAGSYQRVLLKEDVVEPIRGELESMLEQRQQTLALALPEGMMPKMLLSPVMPRCCALCCAIWWRMRIAIARQGRR